MAAFEPAARAARKTSLTLALLVALLVAPARAGAVGYTARACGFDLNHDGVIGDATADCKLCNGVDTFSDKDLLYVDCQNGSDTTGTGASTKPYKTIQKAFNSANGPGNGKADVVCFKGTCQETVTPTQSGIAGSYTRDGFSYPTKPAMLVGWDANNNGVYPPQDPLDTAVLEGSGGLSMAIDNNRPVSYLELAHFVAQNYGLPGATNPQGFMRVAHDVTFSAPNIYIHDLSLRNIDRGQKITSDTIVFNLFLGNTLLTNFAIENLESRDSGGYFARGASSASTVTGPYRFKNLTVTAHGADGDTSTGFKLWGATTGIEISQNLLDANTGAWTPIANGGQPTYAITAAQCTRSWLIQGNTFLNWKETLIVQPDAGTSFCTTRSMDDIVFDRNTVRNTYAPWQFGDNPIQIEPGTNANTTVENITIQNNVFSSTQGWQMCIWSNAGNSAVVNRGTISILNNTCVTDINRWAGIVIGNPQGANPPFPQQNYIVKNNVISGLTSGDVNINTAFRPSNLVIDGNVYDPAGGFSWNNACANCATARDLTTWRQQSAQDVHARACTPAFVSPTNGDYHLLPNDVCARGAAVAAPSSATPDIDGESRPPTGSWDAGADQVNGGPAAPQLIDVTPVP